MSEPVLRHATADDAAAIEEIIAAVVSGPNPVGFDAAMSADEVRRWIERLGEAGAIYLAESEGETAGFGALDFDTQTPDTATLGVWLKSNHRRKGIGTRLAEALLEHARDHGFQKVVGRLPDSNEPALSFLSAIGGLVPIINPSMQFELPL
jgi:RimJ/RimL family protein N-acetyltransferase